MLKLKVKDSSVSAHGSSNPGTCIIFCCFARHKVLAGMEVDKLGNQMIPTGKEDATGSNLTHAALHWYPLVNHLPHSELPYFMCEYVYKV